MTGDDTVSIDKISLAVEVGGKPYFVALSHDKLLLLVKLAESLSENGQLPVKKAPPDFKFTTLK